MFIEARFSRNMALSLPSPNYGAPFIKEHARISRTTSFGARDKASGDVGSLAAIDFFQHKRSSILNPTPSKPRTSRALASDSHFGWDTIRKYGFGVFQPSGYF